ncbi:MAG: DUF1858 domain-containing protein [Clostridia bacterium]|nr:DUF1858 domain-containing protein [Clostridia bacterium]
MAVKVNKDMTINEVLQLDRRTAPLFMEFGMHCLGCPMSTNESIEDACATHGVSADELIDQINDFFEQNTL